MPTTTKKQIDESLLRAYQLVHDQQLKEVMKTSPDLGPTLAALKVSAKIWNDPAFKSMQLLLLSICAVNPQMKFPDAEAVEKTFSEFSV